MVILVVEEGLCKFLRVEVEEVESLDAETLETTEETMERSTGVLR